MKLAEQPTSIDPITGLPFPPCGADQSETVNVPLLAACVVALLCGWGSHHAQAQVRGDELAAEVAAADRLLREGDFQAASEAFGRLESAALPAAAVYNHGIALYRAGKMAEAARRFQRAAAADDDLLAARARFNLGNSHYARALTALQSQDRPDPAEAVRQLELAIDSYRSSLRVDPTDADARANIELASRLIRELRQQQQQQQQQQPDPQSESSDGSEKTEQQEQDSEAAEGQQKEPQPSGTNEANQPPSDPSDASQGDQQQPDQQQPDEQQPDQQQPDQQQADQQQSEQQQQQADQQGEEQQESDADSGEESSKMPPPSRENPSAPQSVRDTGGLPDQAEPHDPTDEQQQETREGELTAVNPSDEDAGQDQAQRVVSQEAVRMTDEEAHKMLQAIRDRDMLRRLRRRAAERARRIPVDRDW